MAKQARDEISFEEQPVDYDEFIRAESVDSIPAIEVDVHARPWDTEEIRAARARYTLNIAENFKDVHEDHAAQRYSQLPDNVIVDVQRRTQYYAGKKRAGGRILAFGIASGIWGVGLYPFFNNVSTGLLMASAISTGIGLTKIWNANRSLDSIREAVVNHTRFEI